MLSYTQHILVHGICQRNERPDKCPKCDHQNRCRVLHFGLAVLTSCLTVKSITVAQLSPFHWRRCRPPQLLRLEPRWAGAETPRSVQRESTGSNETVESIPVSSPLDCSRAQPKHRRRGVLLGGSAATFPTYSYMPEIHRLSQSHPSMSP